LVTTAYLPENQHVAKDRLLPPERLPFTVQYAAFWNAKSGILENGGKLTRTNRGGNVKTFYTNLLPLRLFFLFLQHIAAMGGNAACRLRHAVSLRRQPALGRLTGRHARHKPTLHTRT